MKAIKIGEIIIDDYSPVFIIAEAGINHNGDLNLALKLIEAAKKAGADCIKFQTFKASRVVTSNAEKAEYQKKTTDIKESQFEMLEKLELSTTDYFEIIEKCKQENILFLSTPYNEEDVDLLEKLNVVAYKIASGQIIELPFLRYIAKKKKPIFLSTGMATIAEIDLALHTIRAEGNDKVVLLQCTTNYPSNIFEANLLTIPALRESFGVYLGYSDHTQSNTACIVAVAYGSRIIEKHFTLDKNLPGPDHSSSADVSGFMQLVKEIRDAEQSLGCAVKHPTDIEKINSVGMRRSIVAKQTIPEGTVILPNMLTFKRPSTGIHPYFYDLVVGKKAKHSISSDELLKWEDIIS